VAEVADRVAVLYAGQVVEEATAHDLFAEPRHPYTRALLDTMPQNHRVGDELTVIPGMVPSASAWPAGCRFHTRCGHSVEACRTGSPALVPLQAGRSSRCIRVQELLPSAGFGPSEPESSESGSSQRDREVASS
jgi:oligopeptide/dipeptide ABC transporter ATP-binding protein